MTSEYRFSPALTARLFGVTLTVIAVVAALVTLLIVLVDLPSAFLLLPAVLVIVAVLGLVAWGGSWVVRFTDEGYQVRRIRSAGVTAARWREVEDLVATEVAGAQCAVIRLRDGGTTTLPLAALHANPKALTHEIAQHLNRAHGLRKLG